MPACFTYPVRCHRLNGGNCRLHEPYVLLRLEWQEETVPRSSTEESIDRRVDVAKVEQLAAGSCRGASARSTASWILETSQRRTSATLPVHEVLIDLGFKPRPSRKVVQLTRAHTQEGGCTAHDTRHPCVLVVLRPPHCSYHLPECFALPGSIPPHPILYPRSDTAVQQVLATCLSVDNHCIAKVALK